MDANYPSIIVPLDGSAMAERAIPYAITIAQRAQSQVALVHVHDVGVFVDNAPMMDSAYADDRARDMGGAVRTTAERLARETGLAVTAVVLRGGAAPALVQHARDHRADLIVMTTHGRSGFSHAWFGSVAERVIHTTTTPVLVVRASDETHAGVTEPLFQRILLPIDREQSGVEAMQRAATLGTAGRTKYTLLTVISALPALPPAFPNTGTFAGDLGFGQRETEATALLKRIAEPARTAGALADIRVLVHERAAPAILEAAASQADLIVMPTHARGSFSRAVFGSVVDKVMRGATIPLLLFRASQAEDPFPENALRRPLVLHGTPDSAIL